jgi:hypothetical protein
MISCNLGRDRVTITAGVVTCFLSWGVKADAVVLSGTWDSSGAPISIISTPSISVILQDITIRRLGTWSGPLIQVTNSSVALGIQGTNTLEVPDLGVTSFSAIDCNGSNITFSGAQGGSLSVNTRQGWMAAVGTTTVCPRLRFTNGTYSFTTRSVAIGAAYPKGRDAVVDEIAIEGGVFTIKAFDSGIGTAGIGTFWKSSYGSYVRAISIAGGSFAIDAEGGPAIGAGSTDQCPSEVGAIRIQAGAFNLSSARGAAIGAGNADGGDSHVGRIRIEAGSFNLESRQGAAIGAGLASGGISSVDSVVIASGVFRIAASQGAGIGSGSANASQH